MFLSDTEMDEELDTNVIFLWDNREGQVPHGVSYGKDYEEDTASALEDGYGTILGDNQRSLIFLAIVTLPIVVI